MRTYTVEWARVSEPDAWQKCSGLSPRTAFARLLGLLEASGPAIIRSVTADPFLPETVYFSVEPSDLFPPEASYAGS